MLRWYSRLSLRSKAIGITVATTTIALSVVATTCVVQLRKQISAEEHRAADSMAMGFARASELAMAVRDTRELSRLANSFLRDPNVLFIAAYNGAEQKPIIAAVRDSSAWDSFQREHVDTLHCIVGQNILARASGGNEFADEAQIDPPTAPAAGALPVAASRDLSHIVVGLSNAAALDSQRRQSLATVMYTLMAGMAGALILSLTLGTWMLRLQRLAQASNLISQGDFSNSITDPRQDEIGQLARSFDAMRAALQERDREVRGFTHTLQDQVKERTRELQAALATAEEASRAKSLFLANMSHELRTPLNGVIGMVDLLLAADPNGQQKRYCEVAKASARSLLDLINDILDFSKIEAGKMELDSTDFDLHEVVEGVVQMLGEKAEKKNIELACGVAEGVPRLVNGDPTRLRQVILNLASNALKFTDKGEVVVHVGVESETDTHSIVRISVKDTGLGIPKDRVDRLFQSFSQVDASTTRKFGGTGLGLAISQRIAQMMGGQIGVASEEGKGSTFWFTARLMKHTRELPAIRDGRLNLRGLRALAVDDNLANREILHAQLASWSLCPDVADCAPMAIDMLEKAARDGRPYRFAILDMHMPNVDGIQLARQIKSNPVTRDTILISLSSICDQMKPDKMNQLGFSAWLNKPALPSQLYNAIVDSLAVVPAPGGVLEAPRQTKPTLELPGVKILLAEDNEVNRFVASELLKRAGCECTIVVNGREAVDEALRQYYDVILMDCQMPELDGFEATGLIREAEKKGQSGVHRRIVALTANAIKGDRELCLTAGMDAYVTKPIEPASLFQTIRDLIKSMPGPIAHPSFPIDPAVEGDLPSSSVSSADISGDAVLANAEHRISTELQGLNHADTLGQTQQYVDELQRELDRFRRHLATVFRKPNSATSANPRRIGFNPEAE